MKVSFSTPLLLHRTCHHPVFSYFFIFYFYCVLCRNRQTKSQPRNRLKREIRRATIRKMRILWSPKNNPPVPQLLSCVRVFNCLFISIFSSIFLICISVCRCVCVWLYTVIGGKRFTLFFFTVTWLFQKDTQRISSWPKSVGRFVYDLSRS